ncbi:MAG TPA: YicC/YloC family endoribonuclease [Pseudomonadales bacterium]|nr:YicC/YloC family endoribonuclease [Pseudomonadales bacterium]
MTRSMTAFARAETGHVSWEIRSVNQRYLDPGFRIPDNMRVVEPDLRNLLRDSLHRGKVDCVLRIEDRGDDLEDPTIDRAQLERLQRLVDHLASVSPNLAPINPLELLKWPGILQEDGVEFETLLETVKSVFQQAVSALVAMREREGAELERVILERLDVVANIVASVRQQVPGMAERQGERLRERLAELTAEIDTGRLEQELVYLAQKSDIAEELDRLDTHVEEVRSTLKQKGAIGRRLDFLMQELNREANTLSSKSIAAEISIQAVELKVIIEQMREQIQNIE